MTAIDLINIPAPIERPVSREPAARDSENLSATPFEQELDQAEHAVIRQDEPQGEKRPVQDDGEADETQRPVDEATDAPVNDEQPPADEAPEPDASPSSSPVAVIATLPIEHDGVVQQAAPQPEQPEQVDVIAESPDEQAESPRDEQQAEVTEPTATPPASPAPEASAVAIASVSHEPVPAASASVKQAEEAPGKPPPASPQAADPQPAAISPVAVLPESGEQTQSQGRAQPDDARGQSAAPSAPPVDAAAAPRGAAAPAVAVSQSAPSPATTVSTQPSVQPAPLPDAAPEAVTERDAQQNVARIARGLQTALAQRGGAVTLRLTPPELGTMRIQLQISGTSVTASFHAEAESARSILTNQLAQLRTALEGQGLNVERLSVQTMPSNSQSGLQQQSGQSTNDGRSRGEYTPQQGNNPQQEPEPDELAQRQSAFEQLLLNEVA